MKMVVAIIRHERLQEVQDVLDECGVSGVTVTEVKGCGAQRGYTEKYRGASVHISLRPREPATTARSATARSSSSTSTTRSESGPASTAPKPSSTAKGPCGATKV